VSWVLLILILVTPLVFAALIVARPTSHAKAIATVGALAQALLTVPILTRFDWANGQTVQGVGSFPWLPMLGLEVSVGVDAVALLLIALTTLLGPICVIASYSAITEKLKTYYAWLLVLQAAMVGVFMARDLVLFYICFEFTLIPMYVLINVFGSTNRKAASTRFFLYTFTGSIIALAGLVYVVWHNATMAPDLVPGAGTWTFDIGVLTQSAAYMSGTEQGWVLLALLAGFAVKVPLFPVHTWLPLAHTEAPTAGSVILAAVLLKLGTYGIYRFALPFAPAALIEYAPLIATLSVIGVVYAGLICWVQTDIKKLVAYSSVSHLGFCVLGLVAANAVGLSGSVLYMLNHGLSTGALFLLIGMIYERYHTRSLREMGGLAKKMPVWATFMVFFTMASVGLPGLNGFVSEILCLMGAFQADTAWAAGGLAPGATYGNVGPWLAAVAGTGMIVAAIYLLFMVGRICFGPLVEPAGHGEHDHDEGHGPALPTDLNRREIGVLLPLAALCLVFGLYPKPLLVGLESSVNQKAALVQAGAERVFAMESAGRVLSEAEASRDPAPIELVAETEAAR